MARFGTGLRGVGAACLLAVICLCQSVPAHTDGRGNHGDWWFADRAATEGGHVTAAPVTVSYTVGGSAIGGVDYMVLGSNIFIPAGQPSVTSTVTPIADGVSEAAEDVDVFLVPNAATTIGPSGSARVVSGAN